MTRVVKKESDDSLTDSRQDAVIDQVERNSSNQAAAQHAQQIRERREREQGQEPNANHPLEAVKGTAFVQGEGDASAVSSDDVRQGALGDCWFLASMIAVAQANPDAISDLIESLGGGLFNVTLYVDNEETGQLEAQTVEVSAEFPTNEDGTLANVTSDDIDGQGNREMWPMLLEKAAAILIGGDYNNLNRDAPVRGLRLLTGEGTVLQNTETPEKIGYNKPVDEWGESANIVAYLAAMLDNGSAITAMISIGQGSKAGLGSSSAVRTNAVPGDYDSDLLIMPDGHAYAVIGADVESQTVTVQNPYERDKFAYGNRIATMSIEVFRDYFSRVAVTGNLRD